MKKRNIGRTIAKALLFSFLFIISFGIGSMALFSIYRNEISKKIINRTNSKIQGKIKFENISISPFKQFPALSIALDDVTYYENKTNNDEHVVPIAKLEHLYISFSLKNLLEKNFDVSKILLHNGTLNLIRYPDNSFNLIKGTRSATHSDSIISIADTTFAQHTEVRNTDSISKNTISALFDEISLKNIQIEYIDKIKNNESTLVIEDLNSSFTWKQDSIFLRLHLEAYISKQQLIEKMGISNTPIVINTQTYVLPKDSIIVFQKSNLTIDKSTIHAYGGINYKSNKLESDISFSSNDINLNFLDLILPKSENYKLDSGSISFKGKLSGDLLNTRPYFRTQYVVNNASFSVSNQTKNIRELNFKGYFDSGKSDDFSEALIRIDTISAKLPNGHLAGRATAKNLVHPYVDYLIDVDLNLDELNGLLDSTNISDLAGHLNVYSTFSGHYDRTTKDFDYLFSETSIDFDSVMGQIGPNFSIDLLDGNISGNSQSICLNNLTCNVGNSDALINGNILNLKALFLKTNQDIFADLNIQSFRLHLADLFPNNKGIGEGFAYPIENIDLKLNAKTSFPELTQRLAVPTITFDINQLDAEIVGLLPPVKIKHGLFTLGNHQDSSLYLDFKEFDIDISEGNIKADVVFAAPYDKESYLLVDGEINHINPGAIFQKGSNPIPKVLNAYIDTKVNTKLTLSPFKTKLFHQSDINLNQFTYKGAKDTITLTKLQVNADTIAYNLDLNENPLASLTSNITIDGTNMLTKGFQLNHLAHSIHVKNGEYHIVPKDAQWMEAKGVGNYIIAPFSTPAHFDIAYSAEQFSAEKLLTAIKADTIMTGKLDLDFHVYFNGLTKDEILSSLTGQLILKGEELTYYGIDMDALIEKLKRSQKFNLADLGAVLIAGPIGLAVTKGSDYSRLLINNGDMTHLNELYTQWKIKNGNLNTEDLAFSTTKNRVAAKGWLRPMADSIELDIAVLNPTGCSIISQKLTGKLSKPKISQLKIFSSLIAPVTNLFEDVFSPDCEPFYEGVVKHPKEK